MAVSKIQAYIHTCGHTWIYTYSHACAYIHTYIHTSGADPGFEKGGSMWFRKVTLVAPLTIIYENTTRSQLKRAKNNNFMRYKKRIIIS